MTPSPLAATAARPARGERRRPSLALCAQDVVVDLDAHLVPVGERVLVIPPKELRLLAALMGSAGTVVARSQLSRAVWGRGAAPTKALDVFIRRLRRRIEPDPSRPRYIRTVRGVGYIFDTVRPSRPEDEREAPEVVRQLHEEQQRRC
jgi:DNA-binding response OmpR family regulator